MNSLPSSDHPLVLRTAFGDEAAWQALQVTIAREVDGVQARVTFLSRPEDRDIGSEDLLAAGASRSGQPVVFLADAFCFDDPEQSLLAVDLIDQPGRSFRVTAAALWSVENNLSLGNMDFSEFLSATANGIFRGFA